MIIEYYVFLNIFYKLTELIDRHIQFQVNRTVLHYAARCQDETIRNEITEESIKNGDEEFGLSLAKATLIIFGSNLVRFEVQRFEVQFLGTN